MTEPRRFDFRELAGGDDPAGDAELGAAFSAARALESALAGPDARPSPDLADRIMAAVTREPAPGPVGILGALRRRPGLGGLVESLRVAWARVQGSGRPIGVRAGALAYLAAILVLAGSLTGVAAYTTAGAVGLLGSTASHVPERSLGLPTPGPMVSPEPSERQSVEPSETPEPSGVAEPSDDRSGASQEPGDGTGGGAGSSPSSSEDSSPGGSGGDGGSDGGAQATQTPHPSETSQSSTPRPTSTSSSGG